MELVSTSAYFLIESLKEFIVAFIVQKFGGTSVANPEARERMLEKVEAARAHGDRVVVVVSAMGRKGAPYATDTLLGLLDEGRIGSDTSSGLIRDLLASCGETISACLVASLLSARGTRAVPLTAYTAGISASGPCGDAQITDVDAKRIIAAVDSGSVPVVAGFQAVAPGWKHSDDWPRRLGYQRRRDRRLGEGRLR